MLMVKIQDAKSMTKCNSLHSSSATATERDSVNASRILQLEYALCTRDVGFLLRVRVALLINSWGLGVE